MTATLWRDLQIMGIDVWLGRVGSKVNIADRPARDQPPPFPAGNKSEYKELIRLRDLVKRIGQNRFRKGDFYEGSRSSTPPLKRMGLMIGIREKVPICKGIQPLGLKTYKH